MYLVKVVVSVRKLWQYRHSVEGLPAVGLAVLMLSCTLLLRQ